MSPDEDALPVLDHVQVAAPPGCEAAARRFYGELLGLVEVEKPAALASRGGVWFALGAGAQLHVGVAEEFAPARKAHPGLRIGTIARLEMLARRLAAVGRAGRLGLGAAGRPAVLHRRPVREPAGVAGGRLKGRGRARTPRERGSGADHPRARPSTARGPGRLGSRRG